MTCNYCLKPGAQHYITAGLACDACYEYLVDLNCQDLTGGREYCQTLAKVARIQREIRATGGIRRYIAQARLKMDLACPTEAVIGQMRRERDQLVINFSSALGLVGGALLPGHGLETPRGASAMPTCGLEGCRRAMCLPSLSPLPDTDVLTDDVYRAALLALSEAL